MIIASDPDRLPSDKYIQACRSIVTMPPLKLLAGEPTGKSLSIYICTLYNYSKSQPLLFDTIELYKSAIE